MVFSLDDIQGDWQVAMRWQSGTRLLVVTMGARGGVVFHEQKITPFAALQVTEVDPTGAGDIFVATFDALAMGSPTMSAARFAACLASRSVTRPGITGVPGAEDVEACTAMLG